MAETKYTPLFFFPFVKKSKMKNRNPMFRKTNAILANLIRILL